MDEKQIARFWAKVDKSGPTPAHMSHLGHCWQWTGSLDTTGYGNAWTGNGCARAHRLSYAMLVKEPAEQFVLHRCDNRACVRPEHLFLGDAEDNMQDAISKGRLIPPPLGVAHNRSRLDPEKVRQIRRLVVDGVPKTEIARMFDVWPRAIWMIVEGKSWKHVA